MHPWNKTPASWAIRRKGETAAIFETTNKNLIDKLKPEYEAIPIYQYLCEFNESIK